MSSSKINPDGSVEMTLRWPAPEPRTWIVIEDSFHDRWKHTRMANNSRRKAYPPRVKDGERYWSEPPPQLSPRCLHCMERVKAGWRPRLDYGYYSNSAYLGVYIWEYLHVISPMLNGGRVDVSGPPWRLAEDGKTVLR